MTECSYCNEPLNEHEIAYYEVSFQDIPLCAECLMAY